MLYDVHDLRDATFDEVTDFYFNNPRTVSWSSNWYSYVEILYDPTFQANYFIGLFQKSGVLLERFSVPKIDEGIWIISSRAVDGNAYDIVLQDEDVSFELKQQCVMAMYDLFRDLFTVAPVEASAFWWDRFAGYMNGAVWAPGEQAQLADTIFETLLRILRLDSDYCRSCALDGLERLRHRNTAEELMAFLRGRNNTDQHTRRAILKVVEANPPFPK